MWARKRRIDATPEDYAAIETQREQRRLSGWRYDPSSPGTWQYVCPGCLKPGGDLKRQNCSRCAFELCEWDIQQVPENIFLDVINGTDSQGNKVLYRDEDLLVVEDKYPMAGYHIDVIPTRVVPDLRSLTAEDIPLVKRMFEVGLQILTEMDGKANLRLYGSRLPKIVVAGFNFPVTVPQLHLHMLLPPYFYDVIFVYPRWHAYHKSLASLEATGRVELNVDDSSGRAQKDVEVHHDWCQSTNSIRERLLKNPDDPLDDFPQLRPETDGEAHHAS